MPPQEVPVLGRVATSCYRHRRRVLLAWVVALVAVVLLGRSVGGSTTTSFSLPNVESQQAFQLLQARFPARAGDSAQIVIATPVGVRSPAVRARVERLLTQAAVIP